MRSVELFRGSCVHCCAAFLFPLGCANYCYYINLWCAAIYWPNSTQWVILSWRSLSFVHGLR